MAQNNTLKTGIILVILIVIVVAGVAGYQQLGKSEERTGSASEMGSSPEAMTDTQNSSAYANGTYEVVGDYISPGGAEQVGVQVTLEDGIITDSEVEVLAERPISVEKQTDFKNNYKELVIGKSIDEVELTKVSGSSLTPKGFNDAIEKIKAQAQS